MMTTLAVKKIKDEISASIDVKVLLKADDSLIARIATLAEECAAALRLGGKIMFCGNGGSFADAQHLSAEFTSRFLFDRAPLASLVLGANSSAMSAIGNDYGYDQVFSREVKAIGQSKDVLIAISTSGNSENVISAIAAASELGIRAVVLTGKSGGKLQSMVDCFNIPSNDTARIQECHILVGHMICGMVEAEMFADTQHNS
jgi:D-sedoheptulose 7-phosphate isomerase